MLQSRFVFRPYHLDRARQCRHRRDAGCRRVTATRRAATRSATSRACAACGCRTSRAWGWATSSRSPEFAAADAPAGAYGRCALASPGKDTTTGHWEMVGIHLAKPFPLYPARLSAGDHERVRAPHRPRFARQQGRLGHRDHPGTGRRAHAHRLADRLHLGRQRVPGGRARRSDPAVGAVQDLRDRARDSARPARSGPRDRAAVHRLARQFHAHRQPPRLRRAAAARACCSTSWKIAACAVHSVGKIFDVFLGRGIGDSAKTKNNADGMAKTLEAMAAVRTRPDLRQPGGFRPAVRPSQRYRRLRRGARGVRSPGCREFEAALGAGDLAIFTADHGCDPTMPGTDHSASTFRCWPAGPQVRPGVDLGVRAYALRYRPDRGRQFRRRDRARNQFFTANPMRKPVMAGNWKMYKTPAETTAFFEKFRPLVEKSEHCEIVICPPFTNLAAAVDAVKGTHDPRSARRTSPGPRKAPSPARFPAPCSTPWAPRTPSSATASAASISARPTRPCSSARRPRSNSGSRRSSAWASAWKSAKAARPKPCWSTSSRRASPG